MADLVFVLLTLMFFGGCAVLAGAIDRRSGLRTEARPAAAPAETEAGAQQ